MTPNRSAEREKERKGSCTPLWNGAIHLCGYVHQISASGGGDGGGSPALSLSPYALPLLSQAALAAPLYANNISDEAPRWQLSRRHAQWGGKLATTTPTPPPPAPPPPPPTAAPPAPAETKKPSVASAYAMMGHADGQLTQSHSQTSSSSRTTSTSTSRSMSVRQMLETLSVDLAHNDIFGHENPLAFIPFYSSYGPVAWVSLLSVFALVLAFDLLVLHRTVGSREMTTLRAILMVGFWVALGMTFCTFVWFWRGGEDAVMWFNGFLLEYVLSLDNLFVFHLVFKEYKTPNAQKYKALFYGIIVCNPTLPSIIAASPSHCVCVCGIQGAVAFRLAIFSIGEVLFHLLDWVKLVFGLFLVWTGMRTAWEQDDDTDPSDFIRSPTEEEDSIDTVDTMEGGGRAGELTTKEGQPAKVANGMATEKDKKEQPAKKHKEHPILKVTVGAGGGGARAHRGHGILPLLLCLCVCMSSVFGASFALLPLLCGGWQLLRSRASPPPPSHFRGGTGPPHRP